MWEWIVFGFIGGVVIIVVGIVAFAVLLMVLIRRGVTQGNAELESALSKLELAEIPAKSNECVAVAREKLGIDLDPADWQSSAKHLDELLSDREKKRLVLRAFEKPGLSYNGFIALGAFLGTLLERHAKAVWKKDGGVPYMEVQVGEDEMTTWTWPFGKVQKQFWEGDPGDLVAYMSMGVNAEAMAAQLPESP